MEFEIFKVENIDAADVAALEVALGLPSGTVDISAIPHHSVQKAHIYVKVGYFFNEGGEQS